MVTGRPCCCSLSAVSGLTILAGVPAVIVVPTGTPDVAVTLLACVLLLASLLLLTPPLLLLSVLFQCVPAVAGVADVAVAEFIDPVRE